MLMTSIIKEKFNTKNKEINSKKPRTRILSSSLFLDSSKIFFHKKNEDFF